MRTLLRTPLSRRALSELLYVLASTPLAVLGAAYALACVVAGAGLAVSALGIPILALGLRGARALTGVNRGLARRLLGERVEAPAPPRPASGPLGRLQAALSDGAGWRAMAYLAVKLPLGV